MSSQEQLRRFGIDFFCALRLSWSEEMIPTDERLDNALEKALAEKTYVLPITLHFVTGTTRVCCELAEMISSAYSSQILFPDVFEQGSDRYKISPDGARRMLRQHDANNTADVLTLTERIAKQYLPSEERTVRVG